MAWPRLVLRAYLIIVVLLSATILGINSQDFGDDPMQPLTINHPAISGELMSGEGIPEQDPIVEYRPATQPFYRPFIPFKRYWQPIHHNAVHVPINSESSVHPPNITQRRKKDCGFPVLTRRLFGPVMKRSLHYFANSEDEMQEKIKEEDKDLENPEMHRSIRSTESHSGGCMAKREWIDLGSDYYPRYVKSYHCSSHNCDKGFGNLGECKGKHYTTKVLKRITTADSTSAEDCDQSLPEDLRVAWKLISVMVTTCCDCVSPSSRMFGLN